MASPSGTPMEITSRSPPSVEGRSTSSRNPSILPSRKDVSPRAPTPSFRPRGRPTGGGCRTVWRGDGAELFYRDEEWMMAVPIEIEGGFEAGAPRPLFEAPFDEAGAPYANYDVSKDGSGFVMVRTDEGREAKRLLG